MKTLKVFVASSDELRTERLEVTDMFQHLNRILKPRGLELEPVKWEYLDASMGPLHKQQEYNNELKTCEMCLVLYWTKFGEYTECELETAYAESCAGRNPRKLYVYFKDAEDAITPELREFRDSFATKYGHFYCRFENVDTLRLHFLLQLEAYAFNGMQENIVKVRDSRVEVDGQKFVELRNIPFAGNNPDYLQLCRDIGKAQERVLKYPDDSELRQELCDLRERREQMENSLLDTAKLISRLSSASASARLAEAMRLFEQGDNCGANAVLNLADIDSDAQANARRIDDARELETEARKALETNVEEYRLKVRTLQSEMSDGWFQEAVSAYAAAVTLARDRIAPEKFAGLLRDYAKFLYDNKQFQLIGGLYDESLAIYRRLAATEPDTYEPYVARTLNNLAVLHKDTQRYAEAEKEYSESLEIYRKLAAVNPAVYEPDVARTLNNLANLYYYTQCYTEAEKEYSESLEIRRKLAAANPAVYEPDVAKMLNNLALLHADMQQYDEAEANCQEALALFRKLNDEDGTGKMTRTLYMIRTMRHERNKEHSASGKSFFKKIIDKIKSKK